MKGDGPNPISTQLYDIDDIFLGFPMMAKSTKKGNNKKKACTASKRIYPNPSIFTFNKNIVSSLSLARTQSF